MVEARDLPLTGAQAGIWFAQHLDPSNPIYTTGERIDLRGPLAPDVLVAAIGDAVDEADALHVRFTTVDGEPRQTPLAPDERAAWSVTRVDLRGEADPEAAARDWMADALAQPVDLDRGPLFAQAVLRLADDHHVWFHSYHHVVMDAYGFSLIARRVAALYAARLAVDEAPARRAGTLAELVEADAEARARRREDDRAFWAGRFPGPPEPASLGRGSRRSSSTFLRRGSTLPAAAVEDMEAAARAGGGHWPELVLAAVALYLHRLAGAPDVVLGVPMMGRLGGKDASKAAARTPGMLVNIVPLRLAPTPATTVGELVGAVAAELAAVRDHQHHRFEDLRRDLRLDSAGGSRGEAALVGPWVNVKPFADRLRFGAETTGTARPVSGGPVHDLAVNVQRQPDGSLVLDLDANPATYDADTLEGHHRRLAALLATLATTPADRPIGAVPLLDDDERDAALAAGTGAPASSLPAGDLTAVLAAAATAHPDRVAVTGPGGPSLTHAELDRRARALAARLRDAGAGPEALVAIALPRTPDLVVAVLACVHAGAGWLPLDTDAPAARLALVVEDAAPTLALVTPETADALPGVATLDVTAAAGEPGEPGDLPPVDDAHVAHVIHTSGSTGRPKGVVVPRAALRTFLLDMHGRTGLEPGGELVAVTTIGFDIAALELLVPVLAGACVVVAPRRTVQDPAALADLLREHPGAVVQATPTLWRALADVAPEVLAGRTALVGGEALPASLAADLDAAGADVTNLYGPTETTVWSTSTHVSALPSHSSKDRSRGAPPIGRAITGTRTRVLDRALQDVPDDVVGELHIAGAGLARGYLGRPSLTASRFVADPTGDPGARMYRTGDLVRRDTDGVLHYVGRGDDQVKVRGHRVEPGEIEAALDALDGIARSVVSLREDRLVAHVIADGGRAPSTAEVRERLAGTLPEHMLPAAVAVVDAFPLTANGKVDKARLPAPALDATTPRREPAGPVEAALCAIVAEVLGVASVDPDDDFFALGGHSLLATRVVARAGDRLGGTLTVRDVFDAPTPAGLAARLDPGGAGDDPDAAAPLVPRTDRDTEPPLSPAQQRLWFLHRLHGPSPTYNIPAVLRLRGALDADALRAAVGDLVDRHEALRTVPREDEDGVARQHVVADSEVPWTRVERPDDLEAAIDEAARTVIDVGTTIPVTATLIGDGEDHVLVLVVHHLAADEWSLATLADDLAVAYAARRAGHAPDRAPLPVQYADHTVWDAARLGDPADAGSRAGAQLAWWREHLAGLPEEIALPTDRPRPAEPSGAGGVLRFTVDGELHRGVRALARDTGTTTFMVLHAAFAALLTGLGAGTDIAVGSPVTGRTDPALDPLVGLFVNNVVLRVDTGGHPTGRELLARVRDADLDAVAHADVPFERVVQALDPGRALARHPLFQVMLSYREVRAEGPSMPGLDASLELRETGTAKFDLTVDLTETRGTDGLEGFVEHALDLYDEATVQALLDRWQRLLAALVAEPDRVVDTLLLVDPAERERLVAAGVGPRAVTDGRSLPERVAAVADGAPDAVAVRCGDETLTYRALVDRAGALAGALRDAGAGPGALVGVALPRGPQLVVALLAVLGSGAAYLPLDPEHPAARTQQVLDDAAPVAVVAEAGFDAGSVPVVGPDARGDHTMAGPTGDETVYTIYTSGSTGRPKGVVVPAGALDAFLGAMGERLPLGPGDRWVAVTTVSFDIAALEVWLPLVRGAEVVLARREELLDPPALARLVADASVVQATPTLWQALLSDEGVDPAATLAGVRVLVGGEALPPALGARLAAAAAEVTNVYGPTETTIWSTASHVSSYRAYRRANYSHGIGTPLAGERAYVLGAGLQPVPDGVVGELYLGGVGVTRGYHARPDLTAERFVADPFGAPGERMYRTGDLARRDASHDPEKRGELQYLGRVDDQVKVRGFRIELGDVTAALEAADGVSAAAAVVRAGTGEAPARLLGYVVGDADPEAVRAAVAARLPEHMVPVAVTVLDAFPTTPNGKIDTRALPEPDVEGAPAGGGRAPETDGERALCAVFAEVLDVPEVAAVSADSDFFALGGDSIASIRVVGRARAHGWAIAARDVFTRRTPAALAAVAAPAEETPSNGHGAPHTPMVTLDEDELDDLTDGWDAEWSVP
ncbi:non-ribosomal peptide synthetase [Actinomycetospora lemnae]|uniref:Amino acid adenylation domain-containing protein n=1 Tax=Actinomycetospora lemnae TaxID=3019891 RepID=A0ABT5T2Q7_9PSEU|nr:non-ribosomal peptide synthetase [Actinomycetospora sp. DW7H6]MDD7969413.1 amino acid adenylation domain-containing protein [Actinomycetospora sp. DW7H6]